MFQFIFSQFFVMYSVSYSNVEKNRGAPDEDSGEIGPKTMNGNSLYPNIAVVCGSLKLWYRLTPLLRVFLLRL